MQKLTPSIVSLLFLLLNPYQTRINAWGGGKSRRGGQTRRSNGGGGGFKWTWKGRLGLLIFFWLTYTIGWWASGIFKGKLCGYFSFGIC